MSVSAADSFIPSSFNRSVFIFYLCGIALLTVSGLGYLVYKGKFLYLALVLASPVLVLILTQPKLAVGQFILALFISRPIMSGQSWLVADLGGLILIAAGVLDLLSDSKLHSRLPKLSLNFLFLLLVLFTAAIFSYEPMAAVSPLGRISLLFLQFLALYRLLGKVSMDWCLNLFFWLAILHSIYVVIPFLASGGTLRSFGLAPVQLSMLAFVVATAKYLWAKKGTAWIYLIGMVLIFLAILATQYRSLILLGGAMSALVILFSRYQAKKELNRYSAGYSGDNSYYFRLVRRRPIYLAGGVILGLLLIIAIYPQVFVPLWERFESLWGSYQVGSITSRKTLWKHAWAQFLANPWTGMGPGLFVHIQNIVPSVRLDFYYKFVSGLSAHNILLHYLAESGIFGGIAVLAMMTNQLRLAIFAWKNTHKLVSYEISAVLLGIAATIFVMTLTESSWFWGQSTFVFAFFVSMIVRNFHDNAARNN